ncbi:MAG TPA: dihydrolipoyl dehydrogenase [Acidobacteriota bacterium]|nr:dihydrolipoyl dehydrogenase [Acidobacteriota bacterium]
MAETLEFDVVVLGGGPGGYAAAFRAADHGLKTAVVELREKPGGVCVYEGCIPSKALLHISELINEAKHAGEVFGVEFGKPKIDIDKVREFKDKVVTQMTGGAQQLAKSRKVEWILGRGSFKSSDVLAVEDEEGKTREVKYKHCIVATGSRSAMVPGIELESDRLMTSKEALELADVPKTLLVVGGGYIGLEMGSVYASLGSKVTVVEFMDNILPGVDKDLVRPLKKALDDQFEAIHLKSKVTGLKEVKGGIEVELEGEVEGKKKFEKVLVAVGRKPNSEDIGLDNTEVEVDDKGFIKINDRCRTSDPKIYAIGDVAGEPMLAHKANREGLVAADVIAGEPAAFDNVAIPAVVFTDPELAWAGITETEAKEEGIEIEVRRFPWAASGRAHSIGRPDGVTKIIFEPESGRVMGVGICGRGAGELIAEGTLAIEMAAVAEDLAATIHTHPTLSETIMEAAESFMGQATHIYRRK